MGGFGTAFSFATKWTRDIALVSFGISLSPRSVLTGLIVTDSKPKSMNDHLTKRTVAAVSSKTPLTKGSEPTGSKLLEDFINQRDETAFAELVRVYGPMVYGVCRRVVKNHHDSEEAFQATFLILSQKANSIIRREVLHGWLFRVAYQVSLRARAAIQKRRAKEQQMSDSWNPAVDGAQAWTELEPVLDQELNRLDDKYRIPILMCDLGGRTQKEAALELGLPEGTLSARLIKARSILAERLTRQGVALTAAALAVLLSQNAASAAVPAALVATTLQSAGLVATGQAASVASASSHVAALANGTTNAMLVVNLKIIVATIVAISAAGVGFHLQQPQAQKQPANQQPNPAQAISQAELPAEVIKALEEYASQLNPIAITYTDQLRSELPVEQAYELMKISKSKSRNLQFQTRDCVLVWQDQKFRTSLSSVRPFVHTPEEGYSQVKRQFELTFDGLTHYQGDLQDRVDYSTLFKIGGSVIAGREGFGQNFFADTYFQPFAEMSFVRSEDGTKASPRALSSVMGKLRSGGKLISIDNVMLDENPVLKIELLVENEDKTFADRTDLERYKQMLENFADLRSPEERVQLIENIHSARKLPATKRLSYFLDPKLAYAIRQIEESYEPNTLLLRCVCSDFQQLPNRQLWLPRKYEIDYRSFYTAPGVIFDKPFLFRTIQVSEMNDQRKSDDYFVLNYDLPGLNVNELIEAETSPNSEKRSQRMFSYTIGRTPEETKRNRESALNTASGQPQISPAVQTIPPAPLLAEAPKAIIHWFIFASGLFLLVAVAFFLYRQFG